MRKNFEVKPWFLPMPVLIIAAYDELGRPNAMNAAWGGMCGMDRVQLTISEGHKTTKNIKKSGAFTVSFGDAANVAACDYVGLVSGNTVSDKLQTAGFTTVKSQFVNAPLIEQLPLAFECQLVTTTETGSLVGKIVNISVDERILGDDGRPDFTKFDPIVYNPILRTYHKMGEIAGHAYADGNKLK